MLVPMMVEVGVFMVPCQDVRDLLLLPPSFLAFDFDGGRPKEIRRARVVFGYKSGSYREISIRWLAPEEGWVKLNIDGAYRANEPLAGCGGLLRGSDGGWICGFMRKLGACSAFKTELCAVLTGLEVALSKHYDSIVVECDCVVVVSLLSNLQNGEEVDSRLLLMIKEMVGKFARISFVHSYRECNSCADMLAKLSLRQESFFVCLDSPPRDIIDLLSRDAMGHLYPRCILSRE